MHDDAMHKTSVDDPEILIIPMEAKEGTDKEKSLSLRQSFPLYKKAMAWSILFSTAIIMEGYDTALLGSFYAFPKFTEKYGDFISKDATPPYQLTAAWQVGLSSGALCGEILGLYAAGVIVDKIGYCYTMIGALTLMIATIFIPFFAQSLQTLLIGEILQGIPWGVFQTITTAYASEVCPVSLRAYLTTYVVCLSVCGN
jgi:SP family general alpha glucoside:H+ symporter-like MFS transporter